MENKKRGSTLVEILVTISIACIAISLVGKSILNYYKIQKVEKDRDTKINIVEILEKEIKYNTSLCNINNKFKYSDEMYINLKGIDEKEILNSNILDLLNESSGEISLNKLKNNDSSIEFLIEIEEENFERKFEKEKWMEMQRILSFRD